MIIECYASVLFVQWVLGHHAGHSCATEIMQFMDDLNFP